MAPVKSAKPPTYFNNANFMKPTVTSQIRKGSQDTTVAPSQREFIRQAQERFDRECTFQPTIKQGRQDDVATREERWKRLVEPKVVAQKRRDMIKAQQEVDEIQRTCPFKPQI